MKRLRQDGLDIAADLMLAPAVASMRLPLMASEAQSASSSRAESIRAVTEKSAAMTQGLMAAQLSLWQSALQFWPEVMSGRTPSMLTGVAVERSMRAALQPTRKAVRSNFRRLSKS